MASDTKPLRRENMTLKRRSTDSALSSLIDIQDEYRVDFPHIFENSQPTQRWRLAAANTNEVARPSAALVSFVAVLNTANVIAVSAIRVLHIGTT